MAFASLPITDWTIEKGQDALSSIASSANGERWFCGECGTPLWAQDISGEGNRDFSIATLDLPDAVTPQFHMFVTSAIRWAKPDDGLPCYPRSRREGMS